MAVSPPVSLTYEFTDKQNALLRTLAWRMRIVGAGLLAIAALVLAVAVFGKTDISSLLTVLAVVLGCIGFWSVRAAGELMVIVHHEGTDIPHLMRALTEIRKLYEVQIWVIGAVLVLVLLSISARMMGYPLPGH